MDYIFTADQRVLKMIYKKMETLKYFFYYIELENPSFYKKYD